MVGYKDGALDPVSGATSTVRWRDPPVNRPEQSLVGIQFGTGGLRPYVAMRIINSGSWVYEGTGFTDGDTVPGIVGNEADWRDPGYPAPTALSYVTLSSSPLGRAGPPGESSLYQAPSGAWVFAAGTNSWSLGLDGPAEDARIQRATANLLDRFVGRPSEDPPPGRQQDAPSQVDADPDGDGRAENLLAITPRISIRWSVRGSRVTIEKLLVKRVPSGGTVELRCAGRNCPVRRRKGSRPRRGRVNLLNAIRKQRSRFRVGQTLEVRITASGHIGKVVRYGLKKGKKPPRARVLCLRPGERAPRPCISP
jgi:N,N-dimethylformamidase beta subunit-like, C-terminal